MKAWNDARSFFSRENKKSGGNNDYLGINELTRNFIYENYGKSWDEKDLESFLKTDVPDFYSNVLKIGIGELDYIMYYMIDDKITNGTEKGIKVVINGGDDYGYAEFNTSNYDYKDSGTKDIVENIRKEFGDLPSSEHPKFDGFIKLKKGASKESKESDDYYVEWVLVVDGAHVVEIKGSVAPIPITDEHRFFERKKYQKRKPVKKTNKKTTEKITEPIKLTAKELIDIEKEKQKKVKEDIKLVKESSKLAKEILKLINAGYTKKEINKILKIK